MFFVVSLNEFVSRSPDSLLKMKQLLVSVFHSDRCKDSADILSLIFCVKGLCPALPNLIMDQIVKPNPKTGAIATAILKSIKNLRKMTELLPENQDFKNYMKKTTFAVVIAVVQHCCKLPFEIFKTEAVQRAYFHFYKELF